MNREGKHGATLVWLHCPHAASVLQRAYYAFLGVWHRRRAFDTSVWEEQDSYLLLLKVTPTIARSFGASFMLMPQRRVVAVLLGYIYFRVQDTFADVCVGSARRITGLRLLPRRLRQLMNGTSPDADDVSDYPFDLNVERNIAYVEVVRHVHRFDGLFKALPTRERHALFDFVTNFTDGLIELEARADAPRTPEYLRRHTEVSIDYGLVCALRLLELEDLATAVHDASPVGEAMRCWCDYLHLANLVSSIEQDVLEGCVLDDALQTMEGLQPAVLDRVRRKWTQLAVRRGGAIAPFVFHPSLRRSYPVRMCLLHMTSFCMNVLDASNARLDGRPPPTRPFVYWILLRGVMKSLTWGGYHAEMQQAIRRLQSYKNA